VKNFQIPGDFVNKVLQDSIATFAVAKQVTRLINAITVAWKKFVQEPVEYKEQFRIGKDRGWWQRTGEERKDGKNKDIKEFFHFHQDLCKRLDSEGVDYSKHNKLFSDLGKLYNISIDASLQIAELLDKRLTGRHIKQHVRRCNTKKKSLHTIRLLYYPKRTDLISNKEQQAAIADAHFDRNAWTFSYIETAPGLRLGLHLDQEYEYQKDQVLFFAGAKLENLTCRTIDMVRHCVVAKKPRARIAIVFFGHTVLSETLTQEYIKTREEELGFLPKK